VGRTGDSAIIKIKRMTGYSGVNWPGGSASSKVLCPSQDGKNIKKGNTLHGTGKGRNVDTLGGRKSHKAKQQGWGTVAKKVVDSGGERKKPTKVVRQRKQRMVQVRERRGRATVWK